MDNYSLNELQQKRKELDKRRRESTDMFFIYGMSKEIDEIDLKIKAIEESVERHSSPVGNYLSRDGVELYFDSLSKHDRVVIMQKYCRECGVKDPSCNCKNYQ